MGPGFGAPLVPVAWCRLCWAIFLPMSAFCSLCGYAGLVCLDCLLVPTVSMDQSTGLLPGFVCALGLHYSFSACWVFTWLVAVASVSFCFQLLFGFFPRLQPVALILCWVYG